MIGWNYLLYNNAKILYIWIIITRARHIPRQVCFMYGVKAKTFFFKDKPTKHFSTSCECIVSKEFIILKQRKLPGYCSAMETNPIFDNTVLPCGNSQRIRKMLLPDPAGRNCLSIKKRVLMLTLMPSSMCVSVTKRRVGERRALPNCISIPPATSPIWIFESVNTRCSWSWAPGLTPATHWLLF